MTKLTDLRIGDYVTASLRGEVISLVSGMTLRLPDGQAAYFPNNLNTEVKVHPKPKPERMAVVNGRGVMAIQWKAGTVLQNRAGQVLMLNEWGSWDCSDGHVYGFRDFADDAIYTVLHVVK